MIRDIKLFYKGLLNSYSQVFFSDSKLFSFVLLLVSFADLYAGLFGLLAVVVTNLVGFAMGFDKRTVSKGLYGFNSLLVGLGLGIYYEPSFIMAIIIILSSIFTLFISVSLQGVIGKYGLPYLSIPFIIGAWIVTLAAREFTSLGLSERGIFTMNEIYTLGGPKMLSLYEWWNSIEFARPLRIYFISLGAILFQYNILAGIVISAGLLLHSRIAFSLSLIGFFTAYLFYELTGASITDLNYSYIGFNYILTSIAIGGFFIVPSWKSYLWTIVLVPLVAILTISLASVFTVFALPVFALPFNIIVLLFLYVLKFRISASQNLSEVVVQQNSPEKNLYSFVNDISRFKPGLLRIKLPFFGVWTISQGHSGEITHQGDWRHAWDFIIEDTKGNQFKGEGNELEDYYCYGKPVRAISDGTVELVIDNIQDNIIGKPNTKENWGNTVIIKHNDFLYSSLSHLIPGSSELKVGQTVREGDLIGRCGNSGRSPYPHLHFQMQSSPYIGSKTIDYPIAVYICVDNEDHRLVTFGLPAVNEKVSNVDVESIISYAFDFVPGRKLEFSIKQGDDRKTENWVVATDEYNNTYILCEESGSKAYLENDGTMLLFRHYEGFKNDFLYWFFLSHYKIPMGFYSKMEVMDHFPLTLFVKKSILFFHDFLAPFVSLIKSEYKMKFISIDSEISPSNVIFTSAVTNSIGNRLIRSLMSETTINSNGLSSIDITCGKIKIEAECISK